MAENRIIRTLSLFTIALLLIMMGGFSASAQVRKQNQQSVFKSRTYTDSIIIVGNEYRITIDSLMHRASFVEFFDNLSKTRFFANFPAFAIKTNMLYDAATVLNVEIEAPITPRWSASVEWIFPWWLTRKNNYCLQALIGDAEGRYWFQDRSEKGMLQGWFAGVYVGGGYYDLQWKTEGNQGELFSVGFTGGYALPIHRILNLEFCLGVGYMGSDYRHYAMRDNNTILAYQYTGKRMWFGPTKAEVSLVWNISSHNYNRKDRRK